MVLDGRGRTISVHSRRLTVRQVLYSAALPRGRHEFTVRVLSGLLALEGLGIQARR